MLGAPAPRSLLASPAFPPPPSPLDGRFNPNERELLFLRFRHHGTRVTAKSLTESVLPPQTKHQVDTSCSCQKMTERHGMACVPPVYVAGGFEKGGGGISVGLSERVLLMSNSRPLWRNAPPPLAPHLQNVCGVVAGGRMNLLFFGRESDVKIITIFDSHQQTKKFSLNRQGWRAIGEGSYRPHDHQRRWGFAAARPPVIIKN